LAAADVVVLGRKDEQRHERGEMRWWRRKRTAAHRQTN
jgi:hypothetical protein